MEEKRDNMLLSLARDKKNPKHIDKAQKMLLASLPAYLRLWQFKSPLLSIAKK